MSDRALRGGTATVLVLDDETALRRAFTRLLTRAGYAVLEAGSVAEARNQLADHDVAVLLCDIDLPGESGLVLVDEASRRHPDTAVVMVTAVDEPEVAAVALDRGAYGYAIKPVEANELVITVANAMRRRELELHRRASAAELEALVAARTGELRRANDDLRLAREEMVRRLAWAAEYKDPETANHLERMSRYAAVLARAAGCDEGEVELIRLAAPMHDIGKIGIPDRVLLKPGAFDDDDRAVMGRHPEIGGRILGGSDSELLQTAAAVALTHHERWDGTGYPNGLARTEIPLAGRIVAIADVYDALTSRRRYKDPVPPLEALATMGTESGRHFDPGLLALFVDCLDELEAIRHEWSDHVREVVLP